MEELDEPVADGSAKDDEGREEVLPRTERSVPVKVVDIPDLSCDDDPNDDDEGGGAGELVFPGEVVEEVTDRPPKVPGFAL